MSGQPYIHDAKPTLQLLRGGDSPIVVRASRLHSEDSQSGRRDAWTPGCRRDARTTIGAEPLTIKELVNDTYEKCKARVQQWIVEGPRKGLTYAQMEFVEGFRQLGSQYGDIERGQTVTPHLARRLLAMLAEMDRPCEKRVHRNGAKSTKTCDHEGTKATKTENTLTTEDAESTETEKNLTTENTDTERKDHHENTKARNGAEQCSKPSASVVPSPLVPSCLRGSPPLGGFAPLREPSVSSDSQSEFQNPASCPPCSSWLNSPPPLRPLRLCGESHSAHEAPERPVVQSHHKKMDTGFCRYDGPRSKRVPGRWRGLPVREAA